MGIFQYFIHKSTKKKIKEMIIYFRNLTPDKKAGILYHLYILRGFKLYPLPSEEVRMKKMGMDDAAIQSLEKYIFYYIKGAEIVLLDLIDSLKDQNSKQMAYAAQIHFYTNLAVSYERQEYETLVRSLWNELFNGFADLSELFEELFPEGTDSIAHLIKTNDVSIDEFIKNPKSIMPHFLVPCHPLSAKLLERKKLENYIFDQCTMQ